MARAAVGIDIGKSSFKYVFGNVVGELPSFYARGVLKRVISDPSAPSYGIRHNNDDYILGYEATLGDNFQWDTSDEKGTESNLRFILAILHKLGIREADIVVGLPAKFAELKKYVDNVKSMFSGVKMATIKGENCLFDISTGVLSEPLGTYYNLVLDDHCMPVKESKDYRGEIAIVDIGHRTIDVVALKNGQLSTTRNSTENGAVTLFGKAETWLESKYGPLKPNERVRVHTAIVNTFGTTELRLAGEQVSPEFWAHVNHLKYQLAGDILNDVKTILSNIRPERIIATGGGAKLLEGQLKAINKHIDVLMEPKFANARGFYKAALNKQKTDAREAAKATITAAATATTTT